MSGILGKHFVMIFNPCLFGLLLQEMQLQQQHQRPTYHCYYCYLMYGMCIHYLVYRRRKHAVSSAASAPPTPYGYVGVAILLFR
mmetsp:Transcript_22713/g.55468  ORF Transcript_22713/g.55468 Transcript_22713/m.55468 type:complete len:84 (+) Transcript_22713:802-1053(+)